MSVMTFFLVLEHRTGINIPAGILFHVSKQSCVDAELWQLCTN